MSKSKQMNLNYCEFDLGKMVDTKGGFIAVEKEQQVKKSIVLIQEICQDCGSIDINQEYMAYKIYLCRECCKKPIYSQLTKTEAKQDYLLTESEFKALPYIMKKNPHQATYSSMLLYLRYQLEQFAIEKYGSLEQLDKEFQTRQLKKDARKQVVFKKKLLELRKKTRTSIVIQPDHQHVFVDMNDGTQTCSCGFSVEYEEL